jgi:hypothetical protein
VDLLRLLVVYEGDLLHEPMAAEMLHGMRVVNPMPKTVLVELAAALTMSAELSASVAPAITGASATLSGPSQDRP